MTSTKRKKEIEKPGGLIEMNVESDRDPTMTKIEKSTSERKNLINLVKDYRDCCPHFVDNKGDHVSRPSSCRYGVPRHYTTSSILLHRWGPFSPP
jgi:hypothetical protein